MRTCTVISDDSTDSPAFEAYVTAAAKRDAEHHRDLCLRAMDRGVAAARGAGVVAQNAVRAALTSGMMSGNVLAAPPLAGGEEGEEDAGTADAEADAAVQAAALPTQMSGMYVTGHVPSLHDASLPDLHRAVEVLQTLPTAYVLGERVSVVSPAGDGYVLNISEDGAPTRIAVRDVSSGTWSVVTDDCAQRCTKRYGALDAASLGAGDNLFSRVLVGADAYGTPPKCSKSLALYEACGKW